MTSRLTEIPHLPRDDEGPIFPAPWAARAFAMTLKLCDAGIFSWPEWVAAFSSELATGDRDHDASLRDHERYYKYWVDALEKMLAGKEILTEKALRMSFDVTLAKWPEPDHVGRLEPIARSLARQE